MQQAKPKMIRAQFVDDDGRSELRTVRVDSLKLGTQKRSVLTPEQRRAATALHCRIGKFARPGVGAAKWVEGFEFDAHPDRELAVWKRIADVVDEVWASGGGGTREQLAKAALYVSIGVVDIPSQVAGVTDELVGRVRACFNRAS